MELLKNKMGNPLLCFTVFPCFVREGVGVHHIVFFWNESQYLCLNHMVVLVCFYFSFMMVCVFFMEVQRSQNVILAPETSR